MAETTHSESAFGGQPEKHKTDLRDRARVVMLTLALGGVTAVALLGNSKKAPHNPTPPAHRAKSPADLHNLRFEAVEDYTDSDFVNAFPGIVRVKPGTKVYAAPTNDKKYAALSGEVYTLKQPLANENPLVIQDSQYISWLLVNAPRGAGFIKLGDANAPPNLSAPFPKPLSLTHGDKTTVLRNTDQIEQYQVSLLGSSSYITYEHTLRFYAGGLTLNRPDPTESLRVQKQQLIHGAEQAQTLDLSQLVH